LTAVRQCRIWGYALAGLRLGKTVHTVIEAPTFIADCRHAGLPDDAVSDMIAAIAADPLAGDIIPGSGGARKRRFAGRGRGKSGGYRTVSYFAGDDVPVLLLTLIDKGERADLSGDGRVRVRKILTEYAADYRASVRKRVAVLRGRKDYDASD
jgi:hypothetical protein